LISSTKRGGSPFYYIRGQEVKLQQLAEYLPGKEKEAYNLIKEKKLIKDRDAEPWQRVALRAIKDFAYPINVNIGNNQELFWKWYLMDNEQAKPYLAKYYGSGKSVEQEKPLEEEKQEVIEETKKQEIIKEVLKEPEPKKIKEKKKVSGKFFEELKSYFANKNIYLLADEIIKKGSEINLIISVPSHLGNIKYFVKAKDKKSISDADLTLALSEGQQRKLPVLFLATGKLSKKAEIHLQKRLGGQVVFRQIK